MSKRKKIHQELVKAINFLSSVNIIYDNYHDLRDLEHIIGVLTDLSVNYADHKKKEPIKALKEKGGI